MKLLKSLFSSAGSSAYIYAIIITFSAIVFGYIQYLRMDNAKLEAANIKFEQSVKLQNETIIQMQENMKNIENARSAIVEVQTRNDKLQAHLNSVFNRDGKDFGTLATRKPGLIERAINKATAKTLDDLNR